MSKGIGNLLSGFVQGFAGTQERMKLQEEDKKERDAKLKLYELDLARQQRADKKSEQRDTLLQQMREKFQQQPQEFHAPMLSPDNPSSPAHKQSLLDMLSDPGTAFDLAQSGLMDFKDVVAMKGKGNSSMGLSGNIGKYNPGEYTTDSWGQALKTNDPTVLKRQWSPQQMLGMDQGGGMSSGGLDLAAEMYRLNGTLPSGINRIPGASLKVINRAAEAAEARGDTAQAAVIRQKAFKAGSLALNDQTKLQARVSGYEKSALLSLELALRESQKVDRTSSPLINKAIIHWKQHITGDPETRGFINALTTARTEYAKVISGSTGAAGITDAGRKEAEELFSKIDSPEALAYTVDIAKADMENRSKGIEMQIQQLNDSMAGKNMHSGAPKVIDFSQLPK